LTRPGNEAFILACLPEVAEELFPGRIPHDWDRLKDDIKDILPFVEYSRKELSADQDLIKFLRRQRTFYFAQWGLSNIPPCKRARDDTTSRFSSGVSMEVAGTRGLGFMEELNEVDDRE